jgi:hypothetical protein
MLRSLPRATVWLAVLLLFGAAAAMADTATLTFVDGNTVSGTFAYDVTQNKIVSWNFVSTEFGGTTFNSASANGQCFGFPCGGLALTSENGDVVFGFDAFQPNANNGAGATDELDIAISCGGVANCVQNILLPPSATVSATHSRLLPDNQPVIRMRRGFALHLASSKIFSTVSVPTARFC